MVVDTQAIMNLIVIVSGDERVNRTVREGGKGALAIGLGAFAGSLLAGPVGLLIGGVASSAVTFFAKKDDFVSLKEAIEGMPRRQQQMVAEEVNLFISQLDVNDVVVLTAMCVEAMNAGGVQALIANPMLRSLRENVFQVVANHLQA